MAAYLFLWSPKKDPDSFTNYAEVQRHAASGRGYTARWICPSTKPRAGDIAIVQRTGKKQNGVFATGVVTRGPYDSTDGNRVVGLKLDSFLPLGSEISRTEIVLLADYKKNWAPQASGNAVPDQIFHAIRSLWAARAPISAAPASNGSSRRSRITTGAGFGVAETNALVEAAAIRHAIAHYERQGYQVRSVEADKCGFDLIAKGSGPQLHIEVKGVSGKGPEFLITKKEVAAAAKDPVFRLTIVTSALESRPKITEMTGAKFLSEYDLEPVSFAARQKRV